MKALIAFVLIATGLTASHAQAQTRPIKIGVLNDQSGQYADASGPASVEVVRMAIQDFGGKLLGLPIEMISADHQNKRILGPALPANGTIPRTSTSFWISPTRLSRLPSRRSRARRTRS